MYLTATEFLRYFPGPEIAQVVGTPQTRDSSGRPVGHEPVLPADIEPFIQSASAEIDAYISARYTLPLLRVPEVLRQACADIARYRLYADKATETVQIRYEQSINFLKSVAKGSANLGDIGQAVSTPSKIFSFTTPKRKFKDLDDF